MPTLPGLNPIFPNCTYTSTKKEGFLLLKTMNSNRRLLCTSTSLNWVVAPALCQILSKVLKRWLLSRPSNFFSFPCLTHAVHGECSEPFLSTTSLKLQRVEPFPKAFIATADHNRSLLWPESTLQYQRM